MASNRTWIDYTLVVTVFLVALILAITLAVTNDAETAVEEESSSGELSSIDKILTFAELRYDIEGEESVRNFCQDGLDHRVIEFEGLFFRCRANWSNMGTRHFRGYRIRITQYPSMEEALPLSGVRANEERLKYLDCKLTSDEAPPEATPPCGPFTRETR